MKELLEKLFPINATLLGEGYDKRLEIINETLPLEVFEFPSGSEYGTWTVPDEWIVREAWVKYKGKKILDFAKKPLSLYTYSAPFKGTVTLEELKEHLVSNPDKPNTTTYMFPFYDKVWGFSLPETAKNKLKDGKYEVFIDTEFKPGKLKIGVHTIKGESEREILLFAHLDHPYQANDNLSGVVALVDLAKRLHVKHTVKIVLCPETIGSQVYVHEFDISKVDAVISVDICGNEAPILIQQTYDPNHHFNKVCHAALQLAGKPYRKGRFRTSIGSDEYPFNDPQVNIPAVLISTWNYPEYHTSDDTPEKISYDKIAETQNMIQSIIEIYENDYVPEKLVKGPLMRTKFGIQSGSKQVNLNLDYLWYDIDGKKSLVELSATFEISFEYVRDLFDKLLEAKAIRRLDVGKN